MSRCIICRFQPFNLRPQVEEPLDGRKHTVRFEASPRIQRKLQASLLTAQLVEIFHSRLPSEHTPHCFLITASTSALRVSSSSAMAASRWRTGAQRDSSSSSRPSRTASRARRARSSATS